MLRSQYAHFRFVSFHSNGFVYDIYGLQNMFEMFPFRIHADPMLQLNFQYLHNFT